MKLASMGSVDDLVEIPTYASGPPDAPRPRQSTTPSRKRATLLDRLVSTAGVDHVDIDVTALERDLDSLRAD
jgi:hypothetical protein